jgi:outer membrane protein OmpA-like peptidoglycan-associated protein
MGGVKLMRAAAVLAVLAAAACETVREEPAAAPPPPPPAATPALMAAAPPAPPQARQPRSFLVFFDSNEAALGDDARRVIGEAADEYRAFAPVRVVVLGHTDLAGPPRANQSLSEGRAKAVLAALIRAGVPVERITAGGFGESQPAFVTPDGRRAAHNRRVEIYLR